MALLEICVTELVL